MDDEQERGADASLIETVLADVIPALSARLRASSLAEIEVRTDGWRVRVRREVPAAPVAPAAAPALPGVHIGRASAAVARVDQPGVARSPAVGYFQPSPAAEAGSPVRSGDLLGHVEMLGIHHDVVAPIDGVVIRFLATSGEAVEYGQPLVLVEAGPVGD